MAAPKFDVCQWNYQNPHATATLHIPVIMICNTPDEQISANIKTNSAKPLQWLKAEKAHDGIAVIVGGGPSIAGCLDDLKRLMDVGAMVFAVNAASQWLRSHGITPDWQVTCDAKEETATLIDPYAHGHLFASQVAPLTMDRVANPVVWHLNTDNVEAAFPPERLRKGGYVILGGGATSGNSAICCAFAKGFRQFHVFGFDSCHKDGASHAYAQDMNKVIPVMPVEWGGKTFHASITMKAQAEKFQIMGQALRQQGCTVAVYGDGLMQTMWNTPAADLTEKDKYRRMWQFDMYRTFSPAEQVVDQIAAFIDKPGSVIDFGCGTGRAQLALTHKGFDVIGVDFADNCRDAEAQQLPFLEWDLSLPCPLGGMWGYCCDVMEHIPPHQVDDVIRNIANSCSEGVFFRIEFAPDGMGALIGQPLHLSVHGADWWQEKLKAAFDHVAYEGDGIFICTKEPSNGNV